MEMLKLCLLALLVAVNCQTHPSPCPDVLQYETGPEPARWYALVTIKSDTTLYGLWLNVVLDGRADLLGNWAGSVTTTDNKDFTIENTTLRIHPDRPLMLRFYIDFNRNGKVPRVSAIRLNGREICSATPPITITPIYEYSIRPQDIRPVDVRPEMKPSRPFGTSDNVVEGNPYSIISSAVSQSVTDTQSIKRPTVTASTQTQDIYHPDSNTRPDIYKPSNSRPDSYKPESNAKPVTYRPESNTRPDTYRPESNTRPDSYRPESNARPDTYRPESNAGPDTYRPEKKSTTKKPMTRPTQTDFQDYSEETGPPTDNDYFTGGLPSIHAVLSSLPAARPGAAVASDEECGMPARRATPLIVNGKQTQEGQWPWQVALYQTQSVDSKYICGGTLVSRSHVVTAAHCVTKKGSSQIVNKNTFTVYLGKHNLRTSVEGVQIRFIAHITVHPHYNATVFSRDAAVLRLREPTEYTDHVRPACLWPDNSVELSYIVGKKGMVVGWGFDEKGVATEELHLVEMPVVDQETCIRSYSEFFARFTSEYTYCAGFRDGRSACNGDSGGGMVFKLGDKWHLRGLVSLSSARQSDSRCDTSHYVIFTDLAKFLSWLRQVMYDE